MQRRRRRRSTRREFIARSVSGGVALLVGCHGETLYPGGVAGDVGVDVDTSAGVDAAADHDVPSGCQDPFAAGTLVAVVPFHDEDPKAFHVKHSAGWDGRLYTDLSVLERDGLIVPTERFFIRTFEPDLQDVTRDWVLRVDGLTESSLALDIDQLIPLAEPQGVHLLECSGNGRGAAFGLMSAADWGGVPLQVLLDMAPGSPGATQLLVTGHDGHSEPSTHSTPGASWVFKRHELADSGAFVATHMNGEPLNGDHGSPARLIMPGWYGCTNIKWLDRLTWVDDSQAATGQMIEFATRTHQQTPPPALAKDFLPASLDLAAMPVRVEQWELGSETVYRVIGVVWGGDEPAASLQVRLGASGSWEDIVMCPPHAQNATWSLWTHVWRPVAQGLHSIVLRIDDPSVATRRLDDDYYLREVIL